ncbi:hypothetical protein ACNJN1_02105 [Citrobacter freundii]
MTICKQSHRYNSLFISLPHDQGGEGRHKCCGCAYDQGYRAGLARTGQFWVDLAALPDSQAGTVRHKALKQRLLMAIVTAYVIHTAKLYENKSCIWGPCPPFNNFN